jgi:hypothetical protein
MAMGMGLYSITTAGINSFTFTNGVILTAKISGMAKR